MNISNKERFPRLYQLSKLGKFNSLDRSKEYEKYLYKYNKELNEEYEIVMSAAIERFKFGNNKTIHMYGKNE